MNLKTGGGACSLRLLILTFHFDMKLPEQVLQLTLKCAHVLLGDKHHWWHVWPVVTQNEAVIKRFQRRWRNMPVMSGQAIISLCEWLILKVFYYMCWCLQMTVSAELNLCVTQGLMNILIFLADRNQTSFFPSHLKSTLFIRSFPTDFKWLCVSVF